MKQIVTVALLLTSFSCKKESNSTEAPASSPLTRIESVNVDEFSSYLSSLPEASRDTALLNYAAKLKETIDKNNTESKIRSENRKGTAKLSSLSQEPSSQELSFIGYTPTIDVDKTEIITWTVVKNIISLWKVESIESVTINSKGNITGITHNGSMLNGTTFAISWTEGVVLVHFTPQVGLVSVKGTLSALGWSTTSPAGLITINAPSNPKPPVE